jgi:hypothetical protein
MKKNRNESPRNFIDQILEYKIFLEQYVSSLKRQKQPGIENYSLSAVINLLSSLANVVYEISQRTDKNQAVLEYIKLACSASVSFFNLFMPVILDHKTRVYYPERKYYRTKVLKFQLAVEKKFVKVVFNRFVNEDTNNILRLSFELFEDEKSLENNLCFQAFRFEVLKSHIRKNKRGERIDKHEWKEGTVCIDLANVNNYNPLTNTTFTSKIDWAEMFGSDTSYHVYTDITLSDKEIESLTKLLDFLLPG